MIRQDLLPNVDPCARPSSVANTHGQSAVLCKYCYLPPYTYNFSIAPPIYFVTNYLPYIFAINHVIQVLLLPVYVYPPSTPSLSINTIHFYPLHYYLLWVYCIVTSSFPIHYPPFISITTIYRFSPSPLTCCYYLYTPYVSIVTIYIISTAPGPSTTCCLQSSPGY